MYFIHGVWYSHSHTMVKNYWNFVVVLDNFSSFLNWTKWLVLFISSMFNSHNAENNNRTVVYSHSRRKLLKNDLTVDIGVFFTIEMSMLTSILFFFSLFLLSANEIPDQNIEAKAFQSWMLSSTNVFSHVSAIILIIDVFFCLLLMRIIVFKTKIPHL